MFGGNAVPFDSVGNGKVACEPSPATLTALGRAMTLSSWSYTLIVGMEYAALRLIPFATKLLGMLSLVANFAKPGAGRCLQAHVIVLW